MSKTDDTRSIDLRTDLRAAPEAVWKAISDGEWLSRWFSPTASAEPGAGGLVTVSWGEGGEWANRIAAWQPGVHLRWLPADAPDDGQAPVAALDYHLEPRNGGTRLRLVNSGLPAGEDASEFLRMTENGWRFFLWNLQHVLERHPGVPRVMIAARPWVSGTREHVWSRLFGPAGLGEAPDGDGDRFRFSLDGGEILEGVAVLSDRPWAFAGLVESFDDGVLHVELEGSGDRWKLGVWLSAYDVAPDKRDRIGAALQDTVGRLFGEDA